MVIIAKRIHLFPYRTQKLSSLAAMVLGGQPPGRVARSHVVFFLYKKIIKYIFTRNTIKSNYPSLKFTMKKIDSVSSGDRTQNRSNQ